MADGRKLHKDYVKFTKIFPGGSAPGPPNYFKHVTESLRKKLYLKKSTDLFLQYISKQNTNPGWSTNRWQWYYYDKWKNICWSHMSTYQLMIIGGIPYVLDL